MVETKIELKDYDNTSKVVLRQKLNHDTIG